MYHWHETYVFNIEQMKAKSILGEKNAYFSRPIVVRRVRGTV